MRKRYEIEGDGARVDIKILEVMLDIRELLTPKEARKTHTHRKKKTTETK